MDLEWVKRITEYEVRRKAEFHEVKKYGKSDNQGNCLKSSIYDKR